MASASPSGKVKEPLVPRKAAAVLVIGSLLSLGAWAFARRFLREKAQVYFKAEVDREEESLAARLDQSLEVLRAAQAIYDVDEDVTSADWTAFAQRFGVRKRPDGMRSIGYVALIAPPDAPRFEAAEKKRRPEFRLHGEAQGPYKAPLLMMHPWSEETRTLLGLDIFSLDARRRAILQAVDSGEAVVTDPLHLASAAVGNQRHPGFSLYAPVYRRGAKADSPEARRAAVQGVVFSSYYADELLKHTLRVHPEMRVMVTDGTADDPTRMLFESSPSTSKTYFHYDSIRTLAGRSWSIHYEAPAEFALGLEADTPQWVLGIGLVVTLLLVALTRTIALRRLKEERLLAELTESEARFRAVAETTDGAILLYWDTISYANPGAARILGTDRDALIGRSALDLIHPDDRALARETLEARKAGETNPRRWEFRVVRPDGSFRWVDLTAANVKFQGQRLVLATALDITERIEAEAGRSEIEKKLFEARRMQSLGLIAGGLSHDFNNLVTAIQGNLSCAELELPEESPARPFLEQIRIACFRATDLTRAMLAYAGDAHFRWQQLDLNQLIRDVVAQEMGSLPSNQDVATDLTEELYPLEGDPDQLAHALRELLENAVEAMPEGGTVRISTGLSPVDLASLDFDFFNPDSTVGACIWLTVTDTGAGMEPDVQRHMFDPFFSTKFSGRGLALASVQGIMRSHHGGIRVWSRPGEGARVTLFFPVQGKESESD